MGATKKHKTKGLLLGPIPPPFGGIASFCRDLLVEMSGSGCQLDHVNLGRLSKDASTLRKMLTVIVIYSRFINVLLRSHATFVHINTASYRDFYWNSIFLFISRLFSKKTILHIHGGAFAFFYNEASIFGKFLIRKIMSKAHIVITLSQSWKTFFSDIVSSKKIAVIPNGVRIQSLDKKTDTRSELGLPSNKIVFSFLGSIRKEKGILDILKALPFVTERIDDCIFAFAGSDEEGIFNDLRYTTFQRHLCFLGELYGEKKFKFLFSSDIFLLPSYIEGLPIALLEAMAAGLPIIATPVGAIPEVITESVNGFLVPTGDSRLLAHRIVKLAVDINLRKKMGLNNIEKVREEFDFRIVAEKLRKIYSE